MENEWSAENIKNKSIEILNDIFKHIEKKNDKNIIGVEYGLIYMSLKRLHFKTTNEQLYDKYLPENNSIFGSNIKYIEDTPSNRDILKDAFGIYLSEESFEKMFGNQYSYIEFNITSKKWTPSFDYQWLYRPAPELLTIEEILKYK